MNLLVPIASVIVSAIAAYAAVAAGRAAAKASRDNSKESNRVDMEKEAYDRARKLDTGTIERQDAELAELREAAQHLNNDVRMVHTENQEVLAENANLRETNHRLIEQNQELIQEVRGLRNEVARLRRRQTRAERGMDPNDESPLKEREEDVHPPLRKGATDTDPYMMEVDNTDG